MTYFLIVLFLTVGLSSHAHSQENLLDQLIITITGINSERGQVRIAVFNSDGSWLDTPVYARVIEVESDTCEWVIENIPPGDYGIAVFHDVNGNGKNDTNMLGIPKERYGFSNNVHAHFGPPKWDKARFEIATPQMRMNIKLK